MLRHIQSRLGMATSLLALQVLVFILELAFVFNIIRLPSRKDDSKTPSPPPASASKWKKWAGSFDWYTPIRHLIAPLFVGTLGAIFVPIIFTGQSKELPRSNDQCEANFDADISGDGIRISIWVQEGVLILISILGTFHSESTGAKEVGAGLIITHISLLIALLVQLVRGTLTSVDAIVGSMIIDAQNVALSLQLASKETLAARWQVGTVLASQCFGLVTLPILVTGFLRGRFVTDECRCLTVFWWAWLTNCPGEQPRGADEAREPIVFWIYYTFRLVLYLQSSFHSLMNTTKFHKAELEKGWPLQGITFPDPLYPPGSRGMTITYRDYPATAALIYTVHAVFSMTSMATAEITVREFNLQPSSQVFSIGQIIAIVVSGATVARALWLFLGMFIKDVTLPWLWTIKAKRKSEQEGKPDDKTPARYLRRANTFLWKTGFVEVMWKNPFKLSREKIRTLYLLPQGDFQAPIITRLCDFNVLTQVIISDSVSGKLDAHSEAPAILILFDVDLSFQPDQHERWYSSLNITFQFSETKDGLDDPRVESFAPFPGISPFYNQPHWNYFDLLQDGNILPISPDQSQNEIRWSLACSQQSANNPSSSTPNSSSQDEFRSARCRLAVLVSRDTGVSPGDRLSVTYDMDFTLNTKHFQDEFKTRTETARVHGTLEGLEEIVPQEKAPKTLRVVGDEIVGVSKTQDLEIDPRVLSLLRDSRGRYLRGLARLPGLHPRPVRSGRRSVGVRSARGSPEEQLTMSGAIPGDEIGEGSGTQ
ncbi:hypothetical protein QBC34DRAFT_416801 [Podospora aff. communis PSN243]|uniref:SET domain-containing protein n=1 Tax=Podospora aff. communis PSN243 TaxID=3040156 RepID=A0AAV9G7Q7_9PEZI|nr:hypothetical protein QBC34DRAFT_416801 [Podospora aff. communis PSN243]